MFTPLKIDKRNFDDCISQIAKYSGVSQKKVLDFEFGKVMEAAIRFTPAADLSKLRSSVESAKYCLVLPETYTPMTPGGLRARTKAHGIGYSGYMAYYLRNRYPDQLWAAILAERKRELLHKQRSRGLAKRSWYIIAKRLGILISAPGYVQSAVPGNGRDYSSDEMVARSQVGGRHAIFGENAYPYIDSIFVRGRHALQRAIDGRVKFFNMNLNKGVFNDLKKIAQKYPGCVAK